ncbi:PcfK-like family protein [Mariniphaga sediminis]|uniref:PcfK-like family protein n=1 Tax=Mariniphaga sediminis TaxID=1628158 RepID=UPI00356206B9
MKSTENFKNAIEAKLNELAALDEKIASNLKKEGKSIDNCITYILNSVQKSGCNGFTDDEIYGMALHYYDEDKIDVGNPINSTVVINHKVELSDEEKKEAREKAQQQLIEDEKQRLKKRMQKKQKAKTVGDVQQSLF